MGALVQVNGKFKTPRQWALVEQVPPPTDDKDIFNPFELKCITNEAAYRRKMEMKVVENMRAAVQAELQRRRMDQGEVLVLDAEGTHHPEGV